MFKSTLVLRKFSLDPSGPDFVAIQARKRGFLAWLCSKFGIGTVSKLTVRSSGIEFEECSLAGFRKSRTPLSKVSVTYAGVARPFGALVLSVVLFLAAIGLAVAAASSGGGSYYDPYLGEYVRYHSSSGGMWGGCAAALVFSLVFFFVYKKNQAISLGIEADSGFTASLLFHSDTVDGVFVGEQQAVKVVELINELVEETSTTASA